MTPDETQGWKNAHVQMRNAMLRDCTIAVAILIGLGHWSMG